MPVGNPSFTLSAEAYSVLKDTFGQAIGKDFKSQIERLDPLFACISNNNTGEEAAGRFSRHKPEYDSIGNCWWVTHKISHDEVSSVNADSIGKDINLLPTSFPEYITVDKLTRAKYPMAYFEIAVGFTVADLKLLSRGKSGGILKDKKDLILGAWKRALADQVQSTQNATNKRLLGTGYIFSNANSPGEISQADNTWWRPGLLDLSTSGTFTWQKLDSDIGVMETIADPNGGVARPDLVLLAANSTHNLKVAFDQSIAGTQRIINQEFKDKFGFAATMWGDSKVIGDPRALAQSATYYNTPHWHLVGDPMPELGDLERITGSMAHEMIISQMLGLSVDCIKVNGRKAGYTA